MSDFTCQDQTQARIDNCVICLQDKSIPLTAWETRRKLWSSSYKKNVYMRKGWESMSWLDFAMPRHCKIGWYSTAGFGGPTEHRNEITDEVRKIPYPEYDGPLF